MLTHNLKNKIKKKSALLQFFFFQDWRCDFYLIYVSIYLFFLIYFF